MKTGKSIRFTPVLAAAVTLAAAAMFVVGAVGTAMARPSSGPTSDSPAQRLREIERTRLRALVEADLAVAGPLGFPPAGAVGPAIVVNQDVLPGDAAVPFWPHETGALAGTSETFVDMRPDGSYLDPSLGRRVWP